MVPFPYRASFSRDEYARIRRGLMPLDMDDKWFVFCENDWLSIHRSWTGLCVYRLRFRAAGERHEVVEALLCDDPAHYRRESDDYEQAFVDWLIRYFLLHQDLDVPMPPWVNESRGATAFIERVRGAVARVYERAIRWLAKWRGGPAQR